MSYRSLADVVVKLEALGELKRITKSVDGSLELAEIQRRTYQQGGPALLFESVRGSQFPILTNLYGTEARAAQIFGKALETTRKIVSLKANLSNLRKMRLADYGGIFGGAFSSLPEKVSNQRAGVLKNKISIETLPKIKSWPEDGGHFITLPQVYTEDVQHPGIMKSNLGMYRIQLDGNDYEKNREIGLHYQIHRSIGVHHASALAAGNELRVSIFVGGPPSHTLAAIMPLPEGLSEILFAGMLGGHRFRYTEYDGYIVSADADFCILGTVKKDLKLEGPFGDHLGYYSLAHPFPVLSVEHVFHRDGAIWPHTVVGRPPQEDTTFGKLIHSITEPMVPKTLPGIKAIHAVDAAGVHPLMLAIGTERYVPYEENIRPKEILTQAYALLGFGQCSLAKYLWMATDSADIPNIHDIQDFIHYVLERADFSRDLHFLTETNMDTLDYSGGKINEGSKLILAAASKRVRTLSNKIPLEKKLPSGLSNPLLISEGILAIQAEAFKDERDEPQQIERWSRALEGVIDEGIGFIVLVDDAHYVSADYNHFLWAAFTKSDPANDLYGIHAFTKNKHWGCKGALILDARKKPWHAPELIIPEAVISSVDQFFNVDSGKSSC